MLLVTASNTTSCLLLPQALHISSYYLKHYMCLVTTSNTTCCLLLPSALHVVYCYLPCCTLFLNLFLLSYAFFPTCEKPLNCRMCVLSVRLWPSIMAKPEGLVFCLNSVKKFMTLNFPVVTICLHTNS